MNEQKDIKIGFSSLKVWGRMIPYLKPYKKSLIAIGVLMMINAAVDVIYPILAGRAVSQFVEPRRTEGLLTFGLIYLAIIILQTFSTILFLRQALFTETKIRRDLCITLFDHLQTLSFSYYNVTPVGTILSRVMSDTERIGAAFTWSLVDVCWSSAYLIGCIGSMLFINWKLALMIIVIIPIIGFLTIKFQKRILATNREVRRVNSEITRHYNEGISGSKTSKTMVIEDKNTSAFKKVTQEMRSKSVHLAFLGSVYVPIIVFLTSLAVAFVLTSGGSMAMNRLIDIGTLTIFINYALTISHPVQSFANTITNFFSTQANVERVFELLDSKPEITDTPEVVAKYGTSFEPKIDNWEAIEGNITFENVSFMYSDGTEYVLEDFNLDIPTGTTIAIVGETGAGKSTLVNLACRFFEPTKGRILIDGKDYKDRSMLWLHSNIGYVLQTPHLFSGSVKENIRYGRLDATDDEIIDAAKLVGAHDFIMKMEKGYDSDVGEGGGQLSTGEKQLVSFARAVLSNPRIFVLDEATSSIDTHTEQIIQTAISTLLENRTSFLIAHRLSTIRQADLILVVKHGKIIERGTHHDLMKNGGYYADLYNKQFEDETAETVFAGQ
ncbi:ABC transporter ATP-binding protein [Scatolibacter rhodanostii]|uniref:ABC transporter ATP-binding protein n=1 Tax=Scatolibacter rhodanostii TaxID=2014781 RepID=UPI000C08D4D9|nr:ABC transporter ATP-binding protein [Scatolibacter rhodanostii]